MIRKSWWKILSVILMVYAFIAGFLIKVPHIGNLYESIRNLFFHVPMWFGMMALFIVSVVYAIKYLNDPSAKKRYLFVRVCKSRNAFWCTRLSNRSHLGKLYLG